MGLEGQFCWGVLIIDIKSRSPGDSRTHESRAQERGQGWRFKCGKHQATEGIASHRTGGGKDYCAHLLDKGTEAKNSKVWHPLWVELVLLALSSMKQPLLAPAECK